MKKIQILFPIICLISFVSLITLRLILGGWENYLFVPLFFFLTSLSATLFFRRKIFTEFLSVKTTKNGLSMGATIGLTLLMIVAVNYLGAKNLKTFDFSSSQINSLSDQSRKVLKSLKYDLRVLYFYQRGAEGVEENKKSFIEVLKKYTDESSKVKLEFVEMNENPQLTEEFAVKKGSGLVFVSYDNKKSRIEKIDEQEITGGIVKVTRELNKKIYFTVRLWRLS